MNEEVKVLQARIEELEARLQERGYEISKRDVLIDELTRQLKNQDGGLHESAHIQ